MEINNIKEERPLYEMLYIVSNKYTDEEAKQMAERINKSIQEAGGAITFSEEWGKKKLAYPIKQFSYGYYFLVVFHLEGEKMEKLNMLFRTSSEILRHQIVAKKIKSKEQMEKDKKISEKIAAKSAQEAKKQLEEQELEVKEKVKKEKDKSKMDLKDLDEKLDKILETDDLL